MNAAIPTSSILHSVIFILITQQPSLNNLTYFNERKHQQKRTLQW